MTRDEGKPAVAAVKELLSEDRDGLREIVRDEIEWAMKIGRRSIPQAPKASRKPSAFQLRKAARDQELVETYASGLSLLETANKHGVSQGTVDLLRKLGRSSRPGRDYSLATVRVLSLRKSVRLEDARWRFDRCLVDTLKHRHLRMSNIG